MLTSGCWLLAAVPKVLNISQIPEASGQKLL